MTPTSESVLASLTQGRILDLSRVFGVRLQAGREPKRKLASVLAMQLEGRLPLIVRELGSDELRAACRAHALSDEGRRRRELMERLLLAAGFDPSLSGPPPPEHHHDGLPRPGQVVRARHRQWLVEELELGEPHESALVKLVCLDDDDPGRRLEALWDLELGAKVIEPGKRGLESTTDLDAPAYFGAYLHALKWNAVSAADATRFQAPFRAGIKLMAHQLIPLMKALELPRANLFIADDVGLGKTIEAGLVLQELILRQQAAFVLIACPASITLQWRDEMRRRFGLHFEVMTRQFVSHRRQERGFGVNPWATHDRFIVSHQLLRRPEYREPLLQHLGPRARKSLLILDEAHVAAPASRSRYAVDSETTRTIRDLAPRFDNRLFLSATPHNGHSNSFSALLEILDPHRFTRGDPITGPDELKPVMVRRLKRDLRSIVGVERFPERVLVKLALRHDGCAWQCITSRSDDAAPVPAPLGDGEPVELRLAEQLARYTRLCAPEKGRARLPFVRLQQRLLSSPEAFARTLEVHAQAVERRGGPMARPRQGELLADETDPETHGLAEDARAAEDDAVVAAASASLPGPAAEARVLLHDMRALAERARREPDAKVRALLAWMREHLCPGLGQDDAGDAERRWSARRVILFTEWGDTRRYLLDLLRQAAVTTDRSDERIASFHGGMGDEAREELQAAFNDPDHPVRVLVATDAAREGINLQACCADLFHVDLPWNPARLEQRNGRIDRTLQPASEVRCHYFVYPDRPEDRVLETLVRKVDTVQRELGSLGAVLMDEMEDALENGITLATEAALAAVEARHPRDAVDAELEAQRKDRDALRAEIDRAGRRLDASKRALQASPESLRGVVDVGLRMAGTAGLESLGKGRDGEGVYALPDLDRSWEQTLDSLRPPRRRDETFYEWRRRAPRHVTFAPLARLTSDVEQLHLAHPVVRRILGRFLAQGFSAHDLSRVTSVVAPDDSVIRVLAYARLTLFGPGAARLHDQLLAVAAPWSGEEGTAGRIEPYKDGATIASTLEKTEALLAGSAKAPAASVARRIAAVAPGLYGALWPALEARAEDHAVDARNGLQGRARREADELRVILERRRRLLGKRIEKLRQLDWLDWAANDRSLREQQRQVELDLDYMQDRARSLASDLVSEPEAIAALYEVRMTRVVPVGLVVSWPETLT